jgi:hypothetical protein
MSTSYVAGRTLTHPDGSIVTLPRRYDAFTVLGSEIIASYDERGRRGLDVLSSAGELVDSSSLTTEFAVDEAGGVVAWATSEGEILIRWLGGERSLGNQGGPVTVAGVTGNAPCRADERCRVFVNNLDGRPPQSVTADGSVRAIAPGAIKVNDVTPEGLEAVQLSSDDLGSCSGVYDDRRSAFLWRTCRASLLAFSPSGSYLLASDPYLDGLGLSTLSVIEVRTGRRLVTFTVRGGFIAQQTWEDETRPLVVVSGPDGWSVLRLSLDGTRERVLGPVPSGHDPTQPRLLLVR